MKIPKSFPAKGWRKVRVGARFKTEDVFYRPTRTFKVPVIMVGMRYGIGYYPLYRKIKPKEKK